MSALVEHLRRRNDGSVAIQLALLLVVVIGMAALGVEITFLLFKHRQMQSAADAAALGAAVALTKGYPVDYAVEARAIAASAGFVHGVDGVVVTVNRPPTLGSLAGDPGAVEVIVSQPQSLAMVRLFRGGTFEVGARAVAAQGNPGLYCILALDPSASAAVRVQNNAIVTNPHCGVAVNSSSESALVVRNNAAINGPLSVHGNWLVYNNGQLNGHPLQNHAPAVPDPYADVALEPMPPCTSQSGRAGNNATVNLTPGRFCSGWDFQNNVTVNLAPGAYYIDRQMTMGSNFRLNATGGVTLIVTGNYGINITNNAAINIVAPATGPYAGLAFFGPRSGTPSIVHQFLNNAVLNITGAVYFPNQIVQFDNNGATTPGGCTQVIARIVRIDNNVELDRNCENTGVRPIAVTQARLVE
jgi:hypothetical protein